MAHRYLTKARELTGLIAGMKGEITMTVLWEFAARCSRALPLTLAIGLALAASSHSSAVAAVIESPNSTFSGSGTLKLAIGYSQANYVKCTSAVVEGTVPNPPNATAIITKWSPSNCTVYNGNNTNVGSATVQILKIPKVEAVSTTMLYLGQFAAKATFKLEQSTCNLEFTVEQDNASYTNGSSTNIVDWYPSTSDFDWWFSPYPCPSGGGGFSEVTFSFPDPQFEVVKEPTPPMYRLRNSNSAGSPDSSFNLTSQQAGDLPISGDWNNDGIDTVGYYRPSNATFYLRNSNTSGPADIVFAYGNGTGDLPVAGDWNEDGTDTIGVYRASNGSFYLRNSNTTGIGEIHVPFGNSGDLPIAGDWNNSGTDTIGVFRPSTAQFFLRDTNSAGSADYAFAFGNSNDDLPIAGDWDKDGYFSVGLYRQSTGEWFLDNELPTNQPVSYIFSFGTVSHTSPIVGDWNNDGTDTPGAVWK